MGGCCSCSGADDVSKENPHGKYLCTFNLGYVLVYILVAQKIGWYATSCMIKLTE